MGFPKGQKRDFDALQRRRRQAGRLFDQGWKPAAVAKRLGVSCQSACRWHAAWHKDGLAGLQQSPTAGRPPKLAPAQHAELKRHLKAGPGRHGFATELWTTGRIAHVIQAKFKVKYHPDHVGRLLGQLGWSCQRPTTKAIQRDEKAIRRWKQSTWPDLKKKP